MKLIRVRRHVPLFAATLAIGCASTQPDRLYTLSSGVEKAGQVEDDSFGGIVVDSATLPDLVDRPQRVTSTGANRVVIFEHQRWAEPLRTAIPRVVAEDLGRLLGTRRVSTRDDVIGGEACRVSLDVRRFESNQQATVVIEALWSVACPGLPKHVGGSLAQETITGPEGDAVAAAYGRALDSLSRAIAREFPRAHLTANESGGCPRGASSLTPR